MHRTAPSRRLLAGLATFGLLVGGVAVGGSASAAGPCPIYTDDAGDAVFGPDPVGVTQDDSLDVLAVSHSVDAGVFTSVIKIAALSDTGPANSFLDRFSSTFTVATKVVTIRVERDFSGDAPVVTTGLVVAGTLTTAKVTAAFNYTADTVTLGVAVDDLEKAVGASLAGKAFSAMTSVARGNYTPSIAGTVQINQSDTATAPAAASYVFGQSCTGGGTPAPGPTTPGSGGGGDEPSAEGPPPLFAFPRAGCFLYKDDADDAAPGMDPVYSPLNDGDLDFTQVSARSATDAVSVFAKVAALGDAPETPIFDGHKFTTSFGINGKTITAVAEGAGPATTTPATAKATAVFDTAKSFVIFTFPKADLATAVGAPITAGTAITNITWTSNAVSDVFGDFDADSAAGTTAAEKSYAIGDNSCFQPLPGIVTLDTTGRGVYSDASVVDVSVTDADENALSGVKLHLQLSGMRPMTLVSDDEGIAEFTFPVTVPAGARTLTATFLGSADAGPAGAGAPFTVSPETTVLKAVGGKGSVTATLTDNDKKPVVGQLVAFKAGSKVTKVKTNAKGVAVLSRLAKGTTVSVSFAAVPGKYLAAKAVSAKAL